MESQPKNVIDALKESPKGWLVYDVDLCDKRQMQELLDECSSPPTLTHCPRRNISAVKSHCSKADIRPTPTIKTVNTDSGTDRKPRTLSEGEGLVDIHRQRLAKSLYDSKQDMQDKVMVAMEQHIQRFEEHSYQLWQEMEHKMMSLMISREQQFQSEVHRLRTTHNTNEKDLSCSQRRLQQDHMRHAKRQEAIYKEAQKKQQEEALNSLLLEQQAKERLGVMVMELNAVRKTEAQIKKLLEECPHQNLKDSLIPKWEPVLSQIKNKVEKEIVSSRGSGATEERLILVQEVAGKATDVLRCVQEQLDLAAKKASEQEKLEEESRKLAESQREKLAESQKVETTATQSAQPKSALTSGVKISESDQQELRRLGALPETIVEYERLHDLLTSTQHKLADLTNNPQLKKVRFALQKAVNIPVNAISARSGVHLTDKLRRLDSLFSGQPVGMGGQTTSVSVHPMGLLFCQELFARKIVQQGDEQISSNADSAFPIAAVTVGLWCQCPDIGQLLLAHLHRVCPYVIPYYHPKSDQLTTKQYYQLLGYKYSEDDEREKQDKFLRRMSGLIRLYASLIVSLPPPGTPNPHPHGIQHAWSWLARVMNLDPRPDITATMLQEFLEVSANSLLRSYGRQFIKLIRHLHAKFLPRIRAVTPEGAGGPVTRLENFLENIISTRAVKTPEGLLSSNFWFTSD